MYFPFLELRKWGKRRLRLADAIVRCCLNTHFILRILRRPPVAARNVWTFVLAAAPQTAKTEV